MDEAKKKLTYTLFQDIIDEIVEWEYSNMTVEDLVSFWFNSKYELYISDDKARNDMLAYMNTYKDSEIVIKVDQV